MKHTNLVVARPSFLVLSSVALLGLSTMATGQLEREAEDGALRQVVTGRVVMPGGAPAAGAVVVTSAGGHALTAADGSFVLDVELAPDTEVLEVTALHDGPGSASLVASARLVPAALSPTTSAGRLILSQSLTGPPRWLPTFAGMPGTDGSVNSLAVFDDGNGPALYAGGSFPTAGGVVANGIARWNGTSWSALGGGMTFPSHDPDVLALTVFDDGSGPALYAGGFFTTAGGVVANHVAKWDGSSWSALGSGMLGGGYPSTFVGALAVFDDGNGPALYAGGEFTSAGGAGTGNIAKWDGSTWSGVGGGTNLSVRSLAVHDDGGGPALYAGGVFSTAGGSAANRIAKWDGTTWSALGSGMSNGVVEGLAVYDDGGGPALYATGSFASAGGLLVNRVAKWDGTTWSALGSGLSTSAYTLTVHDDGSGPALYAGGVFETAGGVPASKVAKWSGSSWSALGDGTSDSAVRALTTFDDGGGQALFAGGNFGTAGGVPVRNVAKWDATSWSAVGSGASHAVHAVTVYDDGGGPALHAGGLFVGAGGATVNSVAKWNGSIWTPLGSGMSIGFGIPEVHALAVFDYGTGPVLYAGGRFTGAGGGAASSIAKWDGSSWSALGSAGVGVVFALVVHDDGGGRALYAGGGSGVRKWNGAIWSDLGSGVNHTVRALAVHDDGGGPALFAAGSFATAGGMAANGVAKWDGSSWSALGAGVSYAFGGPTVYALASFDDGGGPALYAGGEFTSAGGAPAKRIAKWDGASWSALGSGFTGTVFALAVHDDGRGPALHAGGQLGKRVARWDGASWSPLGYGISDAVLSLMSWDDGDGSALYAGGEFAASPAGDSFLAKWGGGQKPRVRKRSF